MFLKEKLQMTSNKSVPGEVVDLFCGVGALSHGFKLAGFKINAGFDIDPRCKYAFEKNNESVFITRDISQLSPTEITEKFSGTAPRILAGCAPCQPFSTYKQRYEEDPRWNLVKTFATLAIQTSPDFVTMENVPALIRYKNGNIFKDFCKTLEDNGYKVSWSIAKCELFGVPQSRRRLVLIASKSSTPLVLSPTHSQALTVKDAIASLPPIFAGQRNDIDPLHISPSLSDLNMARIRASKPGGTWRDWPKGLRAACHLKPSGKTYPSVYARMAWNKPSPTMTTQCFGFGNGRFGHPEQDRAISLREAAILQSFPRNYDFLPAGQKPSFSEIGRWIGNAVPVKLAEAIGCTIRDTYQYD